MPSNQDADDRSRDERLRKVEAWMERHDGECNLRNSADQLWKQEIQKDVNSLKIDRAKMVGYLLGIIAAGNVVGAGLAKIAFKLLGE